MFISQCLLKINREKNFSSQKFPLMMMRCGPEKLCWVVIPGWRSGLAAGKALMLFCPHGFRQQRRAGWHFKAVARQETMYRVGKNTL